MAFTLIKRIIHFFFTIVKKVLFEQKKSELTDTTQTKSFLIGNRLSFFQSPHGYNRKAPPPSAP